MKRKWEHPRGQNINSPVDIELHLETPLPLEWQRCLDIQSGKIHFYNTKTHNRTSMDPRRKLEAANSHAWGESLSLDLELNLNNGKSIRNNNNNNNDGGGKKKKSNNIGDNMYSGLERGLRSSNGFPSREQKREMVARVCMHCHLLVMLLKSSPICPNCKFIHPLYTSPNLSNYQPAAC